MEVEDLKFFIIVLVALIGAFWAGYISVAKSKCETVWAERYKVLEEMEACIEILRFNCYLLEQEDYGLKVMSEKQREKFDFDLLNSKSKLINLMSEIKRLFEKKDLINLIKAYEKVELIELEIRGLQPSEYRPDYVLDLSNAYFDVLNEATKLTRKRCF